MCNLFKIKRGSKKKKRDHFVLWLKFVNFKATGLKPGTVILQTLLLHLLKFCAPSTSSMGVVTATNHTWMIISYFVPHLGALPFQVKKKKKCNNIKYAKIYQISSTPRSHKALLAVSHLFY